MICKSVQPNRWYTQKRNSGAVLPFHNVSPYRGRSYRRLDKPGSPPNKTSPLVSLPLHTGCSESGWFPQTAAYQAETTQKVLDIKHNFFLKHSLNDFNIRAETQCTPLTPGRRGTWSGTCRWFLSCSLSEQTPWRRRWAAGGPVNCGSGQRGKL